LRDVLGLAPSQAQEVQNFRDALLGQNGRSWTDYTLRDRRFDGTLKRLLGADGKGLSAEQVDKMVSAYTKRRIAQNAETVARTAMLDSYKVGQQLAVTDAIEKGVYDPNELTRMWIGVMDSRERDSHVEMEHEVALWGQPYSNGQMYPGQGEWGCRCLERITQAKVA